MNGPVITAVPTPQQNHLLAALSAEARERIFPRLELVSLPLGKVLIEPGESQRYIYFPIDSIVSLLYALESGASSEITTVGNEGLIGVASFMGGESTPNRVVVVNAGLAWRLPTQRLKDEFDRHGETMQLLLRYAQLFMTQVAQTAVCNRRHRIDQQFCRWLLLALDRVEVGRLNMTHELIAHVLGIRRESVTEAARKLQKIGAITYCHGHITVLDRSKLEQRSCECYAVVRRESDRLRPNRELRHDAWGPADLIARFPPPSPARAPTQPPAASALPSGNVGSRPELRSRAKLA